MRHSTSALFVTMFTLFVMACVATDPADKSSETMQQAQTAARSDISGSIDQTKDVEPGDVFSTGTATTNSCGNLVVEGCSPNQPICGVRCCDLSLHQQRLQCGDCRPFANDVCATRGGPLHIRWTDHF